MRHAARSSSERAARRTAILFSGPSASLCLRARRGRAPLQAAQREIGRHGEQRRRERSGEDEAVVHDRDAPVDEDAEAPAPIAAAIVASPIDTTVAMRTPASTTGKASGSSTSRSRCPGLMPEARRGLDHGRIDGDDPGVGVSQDGKQRVDDQGHDRRAGSDPSDERKGNEEPEQREAGDGLDDVGETEDGRREPRPAREQDAGRDPDARREQRGDGDENEMLARQRHDLLTALPEKAPEASQSSSSVRKSRTKPLDGARAQLGRRGDLADPAFFHHGDPVRKAERLAYVMGYEEHGLAQPRLPLHELALERAPRDGIERPERLVHQDERRIGGQRARHTDALLLSAGELPGAARGELPRRQSDHREELLGALAPAGLAPSQQRRHGLDVAPHVPVRKEPRVLDHVTDGAPQRHRIFAADVAPVHAHFPGVRFEQPVAQLQRGRLAASGRPEQGHGLAGGDREREILENRLAREALADGSILQRRRRQALAVSF